MFNLVKNRYLFLIISLIVIIPGTLSLIFRGLNVSLDFTGGSSVELRPQTQLTDTQVRAYIKSLNLSELSVNLGNNTTLPGNKNIWIRLNTQIDTNVQDTIQKTLQAKYAGVIVRFFDLPNINQKTITLVTVEGFATVPQTSDIQTLLANLPNTSDPNKGPATTATPTTTPTTTSTPSASATAGAKSTPTATAKGTSTPSTTATAGAKSTPTVTATAPATPVVSTKNSNPANIPVKISEIKQGTTTQTVTILTRNNIQAGEVGNLMATILNNNGPYVDLISNAQVGASVASQTTQNAFLAVIVASLAILAYIWFSFRKVSKPWRYGTCAIIALLHDVLVVLGVFSILGWTLGIQIDALFITALLTVVGFSVHDTIVVFDRIRENMQRRTSETFEQVVNASLVQTMARSLNTSLTVLFTLSALTLFGGTSIRTFTLTLLVGIFSGTYSSIFNASMLLVIWEKGELGTNRFDRSRADDGRPARELAGTR